MKENLTELVFILDRSGSMGGLESDTIGGYNAMLKKQKEEEGEANVTTVLFDDQVEMIHKRVPIHSIDKLTEKEYYVRGCTALLDAIGQTISYMDTVHQYENEQERAKKVLFIITTDGYENSSKEYNYRRIKKMVEEHKRKFDWEFIFLGANMDAIATAEQFGINQEFATNYVADSTGTKLNYMAMNKAITSCRTMGKVSKKWKEEVEEDCMKRGSKGE